MEEKPSDIDDIGGGDDCTLLKDVRELRVEERPDYRLVSLHYQNT
jgi:hypothetical protein